ncbi:14-3-3 protein [Histomonas meleagridis]|uniref:14-3-3 protein n=1 Tax=Histomonas meleagridis TaxID=135588 RepID=UPI00355A5085|nr:14-3-3 protein [Histomonas meleagridis]KAH0803041.1 14-3-3 protein [Histomonas meleagridis]
MSSEREVTLFMAQILDQTERHQEMVDAMKTVINLDPNLNADERNLLSVAYKNIVGSRRNGLRMIAAIIDHEESRGNTARVEQLQAYKKTILEELEKYCSEVIALVDQKLLPAANTPEARVFYEKLKADYYRYVCESKPEAEKEEPANKAKECYENALEIAKNEIPPSRPTSLGLILNYSVFLYEIIGQKQVAIELAQKTYNECSQIVDDNTDNSYSEATMILQLLRDNVSLWTQEDTPQE